MSDLLVSNACVLNDNKSSDFNDLKADNNTGKCVYGYNVNCDTNTNNNLDIISKYYNKINSKSIKPTDIKCCLPNSNPSDHDLLTKKQYFYDTTTTNLYSIDNTLTGNDLNNVKNAIVNDIDNADIGNDDINFTDPTKFHECLFERSTTFNSSVDDPSLPAPDIIGTNFSRYDGGYTTDDTIYRECPATCNYVTDVLDSVIELNSNLDTKILRYKNEKNISLNQSNENNSNILNNLNKDLSTITNNIEENQIQYKNRNTIIGFLSMLIILIILFFIIYIVLYLKNNKISIKNSLNNAISSAQKRISNTFNTNNINNMINNSNINNMINK